jgi:hypothetical protein
MSLLGCHRVLFCLPSASKNERCRGYRLKRREPIPKRNEMTAGIKIRIASMLSIALVAREKISRVLVIRVLTSINRPSCVEPKHRNDNRMIDLDIYHCNQVASSEISIARFCSYEPGDIEEWRAVEAASSMCVGEVIETLGAPLPQTVRDTVLKSSQLTGRTSCAEP